MPEGRRTAAAAGCRSQYRARHKTRAGRTAAPSTTDHRATCLRVVAGICATIAQEISSIGRPGAAHIHAHGRVKTSRTAATHSRPVRNNLHGQPLAKLLPSVGLLARRRRPLLGRHAHPVRMSRAHMRAGKGPPHMVVAGGRSNKNFV
ncbi:hypothetical protein F511_31336 [Dorcoceras hygrometricum]|uniref:Uncharacterized protein n=1 Tax=Dorcoceras hygrometricum TaxID=472368 RepID=A0A2Z7B5C2_9LAMI|nr:hypothetical protein F511_31336 [Dorcoceras hygrometricum]